MNFTSECEIKSQYMHVLFEYIFLFLPGETSQQEKSVKYCHLKKSLSKHKPPDTQDIIFK